MAQYDFDLIIIGAGSGGVRAARIAASHGAKVAVAEERFLGGTCVNVGCIPKKLLAYAAHLGGDIADAAGFGWSLSGQRHSWPVLIENKNREIARLNKIYEKLLQEAGVTLLSGRAQLQDSHNIQVNQRIYSTDKILIATGSRPIKPDDPGAEYAITSEEAFFLSALPERVLVVGGGYIATEFSCIFNGLGASVTQIYRGSPFLRGFDEDIRNFLAQEMEKTGITLRFDTCIDEIDGIVRNDDGSLTVAFEDRSHLTTDCILYATGRRPNSKGLGLEEAGVDVDRKGAVIVEDGDFVTSCSNIYAIGDVINRIQLTPVAITEAMHLMDRLFNKNSRSSKTKMHYDTIPTAVFSHPAVGTVGLNERTARDRYGTVDVYRTEFKPLKHTLSGRDAQMMMKLIVDSGSDRVVGCHICGDEGPELIQLVAVAMKNGVTKSQFDTTIGVHPTAAEELVTMRTAIPQKAVE